MVLFHYEDSDLMLHHTLTDTPNEAMFPLHAHDRYELYCFLRGQGYYTVEGHDYPLSPGSILMMRDGETHKLHISPARAYERIALHFSPAALPSAGTAAEFLLAPFRARPLGQFNRLSPAPETERIRDMLLRITAGSTADGVLPDGNEPDSPAPDGGMPADARRVMIRAYLPAILFEITQTAGPWRTDIQPAGDVPQPEDGRARSLPGGIIEFINRDPAAVTGVDVLEEKFGYSRSYLNRTFRQSTGVSVWEYVILKRLTRARAAIRGGTAAAVAAREVGYSDYSSFYRQYRKRFGCTPEEEKRGLQSDRKPERKGDIP